MLTINQARSLAKIAFSQDENITGYLAYNECHGWCVQAQNSIGQYKYPVKYFKDDYEAAKHEYQRMVEKLKLILIAKQ